MQAEGGYDFANVKFYFHDIKEGQKIPEDILIDQKQTDNAKQKKTKRQ